MVNLYSVNLLYYSTGGRGGGDTEERHLFLAHECVIVIGCLLYRIVPYSKGLRSNYDMFNKGQGVSFAAREPLLGVSDPLL